MARPLRLKFEGACYHLLGRGNARQSIFGNTADRLKFLDLLAVSAQRFDGVVHGFVLMGNHFHLLAETRRANLSRWMHCLMVSWNFQHLVNYQRERAFNGVNLLRGYAPVRILSPLELIHAEET